MSKRKQDDLWRDFPKTAMEFEALFATEEDCRAYWIEARWGGKLACACCNSARVWTERGHEAAVQTKAERKVKDAVQAGHWTISQLKRWLMGTHAGAVRGKHLQSYLDKLAFRCNRRRTNGVGRIAARVIECLVAKPPLTNRQIIKETRRCLWFAPPQTAPKLAPELCA